MRLTKATIAGYISVLIKTLLLGSLALAISVSPAVVNQALADPLDKSSPKIAHGMYRDRGKSSPKIAHGMYRDRGKSSPKIAHGMYRDRGKSSPKIAHGIRTSRGNSSARMADIMEENLAGRAAVIPGPTQTLSLNRNLILDQIEMALDLGEVELADELLDELHTVERFRR